MMWVRFPNGQCVQYNTANYVVRSQFYADLYTKEGGKWVAQVPNTCIIEAVFACRVSNPLIQSPDDTQTARELRSIKRKLAKVKP